jgi:hypothetical protein
MKKIITGACILLVTLMFSPAMAQDGPNERLNRQGDGFNTHIDRQGDRYGDRRVDVRKDHFRGQRSTRFADPRGHRNHQMYSRYIDKHRRHMSSRLYKRHNRHMYAMRNHWQYRHRNNW